MFLYYVWLRLFMLAWRQHNVKSPMHKVILNSLIASYNRDVKVLRTRFTSSHYRTDEGQPSNFHEHVNESGAPFYTNNPQHSPVHSGGQRRSIFWRWPWMYKWRGVRKTQRRRWCVPFKRGSPSPWATQYVGVSAIVHEHQCECSTTSLRRNMTTKSKNESTSS